MREPDIQLKRAYDPASRGDGSRVLVDRVWPRGRSHAELALDEWCKDLAPSDTLRKWFGHDVERWKEFQERYREELRAQDDALDALLERAAKGRLTLVFGARDEEHNQAVVLRKRLLERHRRRMAAKRRGKQ